MKLTIQSFFFSLLIHILVTASIIIQIPNMKSSFKPMFSFLGSILEPNDLSFDSPSSLRHKHSSENYYSGSMNDVSRIHFENITFDKNTQLQNNFQQQEKITKKSTFEEVQRQKESMNNVSIELEDNIIKYQPLRIKTNDSNRP